MKSAYSNITGGRQSECGNDAGSSGEADRSGHSHPAELGKRKERTHYLAGSETRRNVFNTIGYYYFFAETIKLNLIFPEVSMTNIERIAAAELLKAAKKYLEEHEEEFKKWKEEREQHDDKV